MDEKHLWVRFLEAGIGFHHAGVPKAYRDVVETLFRAKHLRIVVATNTLALGINMPCKTVVFAGDSQWLTPIMYRQMSGRAGRRGFDDTGNVVFLGIPPAKIWHLATAPLSQLHGHFPLSTTLVRWPQHIPRKSYCDSHPIYSLIVCAGLTPLHTIQSVQIRCGPETA
jgi:superfamily II RNA helicase